MSRRRADVGLWSAAKYSSKRASCSGVVRERLRRCLPLAASEDIDMARRSVGGMTSSSCSVPSPMDPTSEQAGDGAGENGEETQDVGVSAVIVMGRFGGKSRIVSGGSMALGL